MIKRSYWARRRAWASARGRQMARARWSKPRLPTEVDADTLRRRALYDARGAAVREGVTFHGDGRVTPWQIRHSMLGRSDQFDVVVDGVVWRTGGARRVRAWLGRVG